MASASAAAPPPEAWASAPQQETSPRHQMAPQLSSGEQAQLEECRRAFELLSANRASPNLSTLRERLWLRKKTEGGLLEKSAEVVVRLPVIIGSLALGLTGISGFMLSSASAHTPTLEYRTARDLPAVELLGITANQRTNPSSVIPERLNEIAFAPETQTYAKAVDKALQALPTPASDSDQEVGAWLQKAAETVNAVEKPATVQGDIRREEGGRDWEGGEVSHAFGGAAAREYLLAVAPNKEAQKTLVNLPSYRAGIYDGQWGVRGAFGAMMVLGCGTFFLGLGINSTMVKRRQKLRDILDFKLSRDFPQLPQHLRNHVTSGGLSTHEVTQETSAEEAAGPQDVIPSQRTAATMPVIEP